MFKNLKRNSLILLLTATAIFNVHVKSYAYDITQRLHGIDRYETAVEISKSGWTQGAENIIIATGEDFPDALCAAPLAKQLNAPILLTGKTKLDSKVSEEIKRLGAKNAFIIGGYGVIPKTIEDSLKKAGLKITRLSGEDRIGTSLAVAEYSGASFLKEIVIATGWDFPDALSIAAIAAKKGMPIILSSKDQLPETVSKFMKDKGITKTYIVGGTGAISEAVEEKLNNPERISGKDRYETNKAVIERFSEELDFGTTFLATGEDFPDALAGSAMAPHTSSPIVLINERYTDSVSFFVASRSSSITKVKVLGGEGVISTPSIRAIVPEVTIALIQPLTQYVGQGKSYFFPQKVKVRYSNNSLGEMLVAWKSSEIDTSQVGSYTFNGTVEGYKDDVILNVVVYPLNSISGESEVSAEKMAAFLLANNPEPKINVSALELAQMFIEEGQIEGIRGDIAFCQSIHETGWFKYGGQVLPEQNNYAGIGATNNSPVGKGAWFEDPRQGVRAQIQHLKAYASKEPLKQDCVDPRYSILEQYNLLGVAPNWEDLNGRWAVPGTTYGQSIMSIYEKLKAFN